MASYKECEAPLKTHRNTAVERENTAVVFPAFSTKAKSAA